MKIREDYLHFARPYVTGKEIVYVEEAIKSGWWSRGTKCIELERNISKLAKVKYTLALSSCTAALHLGCKVLNFTEGDEVVCTPLTFCSTINVIRQCGAKVVFCDIDENTGIMDINSLKSCITTNTKGIIAVHYGGNSCDMDSILQIANERGIKVIEDCAHSLGTYYKGRHSGSFGDVGAFSFYATKNLAAGEGGMLITNNEALYERSQMLSLHGMDKNAYNRYKENGKWYYDVMEHGFKYNMNDISASIALAQLENFNLMQKKRSEIAMIYNEEFENLDNVKVPGITPHTIHSNHLYIIRVDAKKRNKFINLLHGMYKIGTSVHFIPVYKFSAYSGVKYNTPNVDRFSEEIISLPIYPSMEKKDVYYVANAIRELAEKI